MDVRVLAATGGVDTGVETGSEVTDDDLAVLYAPPRLPWLRVNMVSTLDGAATGHDGRSGSINDAADHRVFATLRRLADAVVVGAGTARDEGYRPGDTPIVLVSRRGSVPERLRGAEPGQVWLATCGSARDLDEARELLGAEHVVVTGSHRVDLARLREELVERGLRHLLAEGGPHLLHDLLAEGVVDELDATTVPRLLGGNLGRMVAGAPIDVPAELALLLEDHGTLIARWILTR